MNYDEMSDFEINAQVTMLRYNLQGWAYSDNMQQFYHCGACGNETYTQPVIDYCNNWADIGPIIEKHGITLEYDYDLKPDAEWWSCVAFGDFGKVECNYLSNPRRAAAICFLMMQESK